MIQIAFFGTSADPPTAGHQNILNWLTQHYDLVVVWASDNPFKKHQTILKHRTEMLRLAIEEIDSAKNNILLRQDLSDRRTLITVKKAREIWGDEAEFTLVIGSDLIKQIITWYRIEELLSQVKLLIVTRPGYSIAETDLEAISNKGGQCAIADLDAPKVSSTAYRLQRDRELITPAVQNYITQKHLYASSGVSNS
jgi:nicotinate-nucleotide adenylyltransferase